MELMAQNYTNRIHDVARSVTYGCHFVCLPSQCQGDFSLQSPEEGMRIVDNMSA
jgi:hypothetical protein